MKIILISIIALVVIGGGIYYVIQSDSDTTTNANTNTLSTADDMKSISELMESGDPMKCTFSLADSNGEQTWVMYVDGKKVRGDYTVATTTETPWDGHIITDTEWHYSWGRYQGQSYGTKVDLSTLDTNSSNINVNATGSQAVDYDAQADMDCEDWRVDASVFSPPSDVTFTDLTAQMQNLTNATDQLKATQCAACDASSDPTSCRQMLGC